MRKELKKHLSSLTEEQRAKLNDGGQVVRWPGLTDKQARERLDLIHKKHLKNGLTDKETTRLTKLNNKLKIINE